MLINIENYIEIINNLGHSYSNEFLQTIGFEIEKRFPIQGEVYKVYHNKFALLVKNVNKNELKHFAENLAEKLEEPLEFNNIPIYLDTQVGIAVYPENAHDENTLFQNAYLAVYKAEEKRKRFAFYDESYNEAGKNNFFLLGETKSALENNNFVIYYQPKITLKDGSVDGAEALIRWNHPKKGMIPPGNFIPLIENTALINKLTYWILEKVIIDIHEMSKEGIDINIAVNITPRNLEANFPEEIKNLLTYYGVSPERIELELTETDIMKEFAVAEEVLTTLGGRGIKISIDDFGTGYSSLAYLKNLPINNIKIDQSFVRNIIEDPKDREIVTTAIKMGMILDKQTIAEGVESKEALNLLKELGGDYAQGYFISKPKPYQDFIQWYNDYNNSDNNLLT